MDEVAELPTAAGFKDRRTGLRVYGILLIILGCLVALMIPLILVGQAMARQVQGAEPTPFRFLLPAMFLYVVLAVAFIWLGIGSMQCRRWARALLLVISWMWLICGIIGIAAMAFFLPQAMAHASTPSGSPPVPPGVLIVVMFFTLAFSAVIYVGIPVALVLFYKSRHVKATCEAHDPVPRWTDACPLPVLALSLILAWSGAFMLLSILSSNSVVPFFGRYLSGGPGAVVLLVAAAVYGWAAWALYKLNIVGWWVTFLFLALLLSSFVITISRLGVVSMYEQMDMPKAKLDTLRQMGFVNSPLTPVLMVAFGLPFLGFILYTRKFFTKR